MSEKTDIKSMDLEELKTFFSDMGEKAFRAKQVYEWLHVRQVESFEEMTNLSKTLRRDWMRPAGSSHSEKNRYRFQNWMEPANICFYWKTEMSLRVC